jgi:multidrug efflux system outer membrane protein
MTHKMSKRCKALLSALLAAGCTVGPEYQKPALQVPTSFRTQIAATDGGSFADQPWSVVFRDPVLQGLLKEALANNNDLQLTLARIEQARAQIDIVESQGRPQLGYRGEAAGDKSLITPRNFVS